MYQSGRAGDGAKKRKSPAKSGRVGITANVNQNGNLSSQTLLLSVLYVDQLPTISSLNKESNDS